MSSKSPCAACKGLRRKCTLECVLAPYFPPDNPQKFANVHRVFGASNVTKILTELNASQREDAVNSLEYEAKARLHDPVHGCVGVISILQHRLHHLKSELQIARKELAAYLGPQAMASTLSQAALMHPGLMQQQTMAPMLGISTGPSQPTHLHQHQFLQTQAQFAAAMAARDAHYGMCRSYDQQQQEMGRFDAGFDEPGFGAETGLNQMTMAGEMSPSLALGTYDEAYEQMEEQKQEHQGHGHPFQVQLLPDQHGHQISGSEEVKTSTVLSC